MENSLNPAGSDLIGQREQRLQKILKLTSLGINPYPSKSARNRSAKEVIEGFDQLEGKEVVVVGRIMTWRQHGEIQFIDLQEASGEIQLYIHNEKLEPTSAQNQNLGVDDLHLLDLGDFIEATGVVTKTKRGEVSITPSRIKILTKAIRPLPNKWQGLAEKEARFRRRYLDMTMNPDIRLRFERRAKFWNEVRNFLNEHGFHEVNIPVLEHTTGGADAKPFETYYDALGEFLYLRISHELPLKRLIGAGFEKVYDLGPRFRNEGFSDEHLPEHIAMEWYWAYADYRDGMKFTEDLFKTVLKNVYGTLQFNLKGHEIDLSKEWEVIDFTTIIKERLGVDIFNDSEEKMREVLKRENPEVVDGAINRNRLADSLWKLIRKDIAGPAFLVGVPKFLSPLAKSNVDNPEITDRFHPIIAGSEMANAFSELNDPVDQLDRFVDQEKLRKEGDEEAQMMDIDFVEMLEYGMPPTVGFGMSERVFWTFENVSAREGVPFPPLKRGYENNTKKIYGELFDFEMAERMHKRKSNSKPIVKSNHSDEQDLTQKMVILLSDQLAGWQLTNTVGHLTAYLGSKIGDRLTSRATFETNDGKQVNANSQYPVIALSAKPGQLYNFLLKVEEAGLEHLAYTQDMIDYNLDVDLQKVLEGQRKESLKYIGVGVFGPNDMIDSLTKKFSLWK